MNPGNRFLLVDDDELFCGVMGAAIAKRGYEVMVAHDAEQAELLASQCPPDYVTLDLRMSGPSGLTVIEKLRALNDQVKIVVLTGYASIATAVEAIKLGATHYITKPADANQVASDEGDASAEVSERPMSVDRLDWEHIQSVMSDCGGNVSEAARRLGMHRRTLQRKLNKRPVRA